jgi:hypothetical protein
MKKTMLLSALLIACSPKEQPATDTAAMAAAAPAALTAADLAGAWNGVTFAAGSDSVLVRWTVVSATGMESKGIMEGQADSLTYTHTFDADSFVATSAPYPDSALPGKPEVVARAVGRLVDGKLQGTATQVLASKPDSVLSRSRWEATKTP